MKARRPLGYCLESNIAGLGRLQPTHVHTATLGGAEQRIDALRQRHSRLLPNIQRPWVFVDGQRFNGDLQVHAADRRD